MPNDDLQAIGQLANLPIGEIFRSVALGIAEAQTRLDESSMAVAELMSGTRVESDGTEVDSRVYFGFTAEVEDKRVVRKPERLSMIELGFTPTFYQFVDTVIEIKLAVSVSKIRQASGSTTDENDSSSRGRNIWASASQSDYGVSATPIDATYSSSYNFKGEFVSTFKTKLVPIPPPALLEDRIRMILQRPAEAEAALAAAKEKQTEKKNSTESSDAL